MTKKYDRIVLDIDNTITDLQTVLDIISFKLNKPAVTVADIHSYNLSKAFNITPEEDQRFWKENEDFIARHSTLAKRRTFEMLNRHTHKDTRIDVVTMRPENVYHTTKDWLIRNGVPFNQLICIGKEGMGVSKIAIAEDLKAEAIFEDNPVMFEHVKENKIQTDLDLFLVDYPYNQTIQNGIRLNNQTGQRIHQSIYTLK